MSRQGPLLIGHLLFQSPSSPFHSSSPPSRLATGAARGLVVEAKYSRLRSQPAPSRARPDCVAPTRAPRLAPPHSDGPSSRRAVTAPRKVTNAFSSTPPSLPRPTPCCSAGAYWFPRLILGALGIAEWARCGFEVGFDLGSRCFGGDGAFSRAEREGMQGFFFPLLRALLRLILKGFGHRSRFIPARNAEGVMVLCFLPPPYQDVGR